MNAPLPGLPRHVKPVVIRPERCEMCKFATPDGGGFLCHRNPPTGAVIPGPGGPMPVAVFPPVHGHAWCGEFQKKIVLNG